jgi:hypothetical protein
MSGRPSSRDHAKALGVPSEELARAAVGDLADKPADDFQAVGEDVLAMNTEPYRRVCRRALALVVLLAGCGTVKTPTEPPADGPGGVPAFTFTQIQTQIFTPTCAKSGCHAASTGGQQGLVLDSGVSYGLLVNHPATENSTLDRVEPGAPERSYLILKLRGDPSITGDRMPQDGPPYLSTDQIEGIAAWIRAGAPNN